MCNVCNLDLGFAISYRACSSQAMLPMSSASGCKSACLVKQLSSLLFSTDTATSVFWQMLFSVEQYLYWFCSRTKLAKTYLAKLIASACISDLCKCWAMFKGNENKGTQKTTLRRFCPYPVAKVQQASNKS